ncbi:Arm DNA-binding domain-containing protein [Achromobacter xylosoxidans]
MARQVVPLTAPKCRQAKFSPTGGNKLFDSGGLFLELLRSGAKKWRVRYRSPVTGKESMLTIGLPGRAAGPSPRRALTDRPTAGARG